MTGEEYEALYDQNALDAFAGAESLRCLRRSRVGNKWIYCEGSETLTKISRQSGGSATLPRVYIFAVYDCADCADNDDYVHSAYDITPN